MTQAVARILAEADQLSAPERVELTDRLVESLAHDLPSDIAQAQVMEVRRRITQTEIGEEALISGEEALARVRQLVSLKNRAS